MNFPRFSRCLRETKDWKEALAPLRESRSGADAQGKRTTTLGQANNLCFCVLNAPGRVGTGVEGFFRAFCLARHLGTRSLCLSHSCSAFALGLTPPSNPLFRLG